MSAGKQFKQGDQIVLEGISPECIRVVISEDEYENSPYLQLDHARDYQASEKHLVFFALFHHRWTVPSCVCKAPECWYRLAEAFEVDHTISYNLPNAHSNTFVMLLWEEMDTQDGNGF